MAYNNEPMTDARLAEIRATLADERGMGDITERLNSEWMSIRFSAQVAQAALDLLAEVERLRTGHAATEMPTHGHRWWLQRGPNGRLEVMANSSCDICGLTPEAVANESAIKTLQRENAAMRRIVEAVAEAGVGDEYGGGSWLMFAGYDAETVRQQARALLAPGESEA